MTLLTVRDLRRPGLAPVGLELAAGECVAVVGPSGAGKSLLLRAIADLDPHEGTAALDGETCDAIPAPSWRRRVTYLPPESGWWSEIVGDHFTDWAAVAPLVARLLLPEECESWPVQRLSTGERQRLALVRVLALRPRVLLLDEPTSGLDEAAVAVVETLVGEHLQAGAGALWVTHDKAQAQRVAARSLALRGALAEEGGR